MLPSEVAILTVSCDKYQCWWDIFFNRLEKYWPDNRLVKYLLTNQIEYERVGVTNIATGDDLDWSSNLLFALDHIAEETILLMLEDAPLAEAVDSDAFQSHIDAFARLEMDYLNLKASPKPVRFDADVYGIYPPDLLYRAALVPCIWKKSTLRELLLRGESAWQFEIRGSARSARFARFYALHQPFFKILHCVIEGVVDRTAYRALRATGEIEAVNFRQMGIGHALSLATKVAVSRAASAILGKQKTRLRRLYFTYIRPRPEWI